MKRAERTKLFKSVNYRLDTNKEYVRLQFVHQDGSSHAFAVPVHGMPGLVRDMYQFTTLLDAEVALFDESEPEPDGSQPLPPTQAALFQARSVETVRWQAGAVLLRAITSEGMTIQLLLTPEQQRQIDRAWLSSHPWLQQII